MTTLTLARVYRIPLALGFITFVGLLSALLGDGVWDALSWVLLAIPLSLLCFFLCHSEQAGIR